MRRWVTELAREARELEGHFQNEIPVEHGVN